ncbi:MAG: GNAT family N-acetyltransferase [Chloroflexi bacterium]|nr:GNAT family N-acetyltransferase [Chloroflexota bacterium]
MIDQALPSQWATARLTLHDSQLSDAPRLTQIFNACAYVEPWDPTFHPIPETELAQLIVDSLSHENVRASFRLQWIQPTLATEPVGYFHGSHHMPQPNVFFISMFVLHPDQQQLGYGREVIEGLAEQLRQRGFTALWLRVYLKNWPALRFWIGQGFTAIIKMDGDALHTVYSQASLILEKKLSS